MTKKAQGNYTFLLAAPVIIIATAISITMGLQFLESMRGMYPPSSLAHGVLDFAVKAMLSFSKLQPTFAVLIGLLVVMKLLGIGLGFKMPRTDGSMGRWVDRRIEHAKGKFSNKTKDEKYDVEDMFDKR